MRNWILVFLLLGFVLVVSSSRVIAGDDVEEIRATIEAINDKLARAMVSADTVTPYAYYTDDVISMPNYMEMAIGIEAVKGNNRTMQEMGMKFHSMTFTTSEVMNCGDLVLEIGHYGMSLSWPGAEKPVADNGKYINMWEKQSDGSLKIKVEMWNADTTP